MATILQLKVAKGRLFEKVSLECCNLTLITNIIGKRVTHTSTDTKFSKSYKWQVLWIQTYAHFSHTTGSHAKPNHAA